MTRRYLNLRQVAEAMQVSLSWLRRHLPELERDHNFPPALPGMGTRRDAAAIKAWQQAGVPPALRTPPEGSLAPDALELWGAELDRRAEALAERDQRDAAIVGTFGKDILKLRLPPSRGTPS